MRRPDSACQKARCVHHISHGKDCKKCDVLRRKTDDLKECLSARDCIIQMLRDQLGKYETLYKKSTDQGENFRYKYCTTAQKLHNLREILKEREKDNLKVCSLRENDVDTFKKSRKESDSPKRSCSGRCSRKEAEVAKKLPVQAEIQKACDFQCGRKCHIVQTTPTKKSTCNTAKIDADSSLKSPPGSPQVEIQKACDFQCGRKCHIVQTTQKKKSTCNTAITDADSSPKSPLGSPQVEMQKTCDFQCGRKCHITQKKKSACNTAIIDADILFKSPPGGHKSPCTPRSPCTPKSPTSSKSPTRQRSADSPKSPCTPKSPKSSRCSRCRSSPEKESRSRTPSPTAVRRPSRVEMVLQKKDQQIANLQEALAAKNKEINDFVERLETINKKMFNDLDEKNRQISDLNLQLKRVLGESKSGCVQVPPTSASCQRHCAIQIQSLKDEVKTLKDDLHKKDKEINEFVSRLEAINAKMQRDLDEKNRQISNLNLQLRRAIDESKSALNCNCNLAYNLQEKERQISIKDEEIQKLKDGMRSSIQEEVGVIMANLLDRISQKEYSNQCQSEIQARDKIINDLRKELGDIGKKAPKIHDICQKSICYSKLYDKEREIEKLKQELASKDTELKEAKEKINELQKEVDELRNALHQSEEVKELREEVAIRDQRIAELVGELHHEMTQKDVIDKGRRRTVQKKMDELEAENDRLRTQLGELLHTMIQPAVAIPEIKEVELETVNNELDDREKEIQKLRERLNNTADMSDVEVRELRKALRIKEKEVEELQTKMDELMKGDAPTTVKEMLMMKNKRIENLLRQLNGLNMELRDLKKEKNQPPNVLLLKIDALEKEVEEKDDQIKELKLRVISQQYTDSQGGKDRNALNNENEELRFKLAEKDRIIKTLTLSNKRIPGEDGSSEYSMISECGANAPGMTGRKSMVNLLTEVNFLNKILEDKNREIEELKAIIEKSEYVPSLSESVTSSDKNVLIEDDNKEKTEKEIRKTYQAVEKELESKQRQIEEMKAQLAQFMEPKGGVFTLTDEEESDEHPVKVFRRSLEQKDEEFEVLATEFSNLQKENEDLLKKLSENEQVIKKLEGIISKFGYTEQSLKDNIKDMEQLIDAYKNKVQDLYREIESYKVMNDKNMAEIKEMSVQMMEVLPGSTECVSVQVDRDYFCTDVAVLEQLDWKVVEENQCNAGLYEKNMELERKLYMLKEELDKVKDFHLIIEELESQVEALQDKLRKKEEQNKQTLRELRKVQKRIHILEKCVASGEVHESKVPEDLKESFQSLCQDDKSMKVSSNQFNNEIVKIHNQLNKIFETLQKGRSNISTTDESLMTDVYLSSEASCTTSDNFSSEEIACGTCDYESAFSSMSCQTSGVCSCSDKGTQSSSSTDDLMILNDELRRALEAIKWDNVNMLCEMEELLKQLNYQTVANEELEHKLQGCMRKQAEMMPMHTNTDIVARKNVRTATDFEIENLSRVVEELSRKNKILENELANLKVLQPKRTCHGNQRQPLAYITRSIDCLQRQLIIYEEEIKFLQKAIANSPTCYKTMLTEPEKNKLFNRLEYELMQKILQLKTLKVRYDTELMRNNELKESNKSLIIENKELKNVVNDLLWQLDKCICIKDKDKFKYMLEMEQKNPKVCDCINMITDVYHMQVSPVRPTSRASCVCSTGKCKKTSTQVLFKKEGMSLSSHGSTASGPEEGSECQQGKNRSYSLVIQQMRQRILEEKHKNDAQEFYFKDKEDQIKDKDQLEAELREEMYTKALRRPSSAFEVEIKEEKINSMSDIKGIKQMQDRLKQSMPAKSAFKNSKDDTVSSPNNADSAKRVSYSDRTADMDQDSKKDEDSHQHDTFQYYQNLGESDPKKLAQSEANATPRVIEGGDQMLQMDDLNVKGLFFNENNMEDSKDEECEESATDDSCRLDYEEDIKKTATHKIPIRIKHQSQLVSEREQRLSKFRPSFDDRNSNAETQTSATPKENSSTGAPSKVRLRKSKSDPTTPVKDIRSSTATPRSSVASGTNDSHPAHFLAVPSVKLPDDVEEKLMHVSLNYAGTGSSNMAPMTEALFVPSTDTGTSSNPSESPKEKQLPKKVSEKKKVKKRKAKTPSKIK